MKQKAVFLLILFLLIAGVGIIVKVLNSRTPAEGQLRVETSPTVSVYLDGKRIGEAPIDQKIASGEYTMKLVPESPTSSVAGWQGKVTIGPNLLTFVNASLSESELSSAIDVLWLERITSKKAELSVITNPDGATVVIDDKTKGMTPLTIQDISPGEHTLTVTSQGFLTRTVKIKLTAGYKVISTLKLALSGTAKETGQLAPEDTKESASPSATPAPTGKTSASTNALTPPYVRILDTPTGFLRVRAEASTSASESGRVKPGETYPFLSEKSGWFEIQLNKTVSGWISGQYAQKVTK